jgi:hypothetical protein
MRVSVVATKHQQLLERPSELHESVSGAIGACGNRSSSGSSGSSSITGVFAAAAQRTAELQKWAIGCRSCALCCDQYMPASRCRQRNHRTHVQDFNSMTSCL